jgi:hypothetical protein
LNASLELTCPARPSATFLRTKIEQFIAYFNATMAKPFRWTYAGKPLAGAAGAAK